MFKRKTVDDILKSFAKVKADLEKVIEENKRTIERLNQEIADRKDHRNTLDRENDRASDVISSIEDVFSV